MIELTKEQKKIIYIAAVVVIFLFLFWFFIHIPQSRKFRDLKHKLNITEAEIAEINRITGGMPLPEAVRDLSLKLKESLAQLPFAEENVVEKLSTAARGLKMVIQNVTLSDRKTIKGKIPGYDIMELPISMKLVSEYRPLGEYLINLEDNFPVLIRIRNVSINGVGEGQYNLSVDLELSAYLLGYPTGQ